MPVPLEIRTGRRASRWAPILMGVLAVAFTVFAVAVEIAVWERLALVAVALMCGAIALGAARTSRAGTPMIVLRDEGLEHRWMGLIPWDDIDEVRVYDASGSRLLGLELHDAGRYVARVPWWPMRLLARLNPVFGYPTLSLALWTLELSEEELIAEMEARARRPLTPEHRSDMSGV